MPITQLHAYMPIDDLKLSTLQLIDLVITKLLMISIQYPYLVSTCLSSFTSLCFSFLYDPLALVGYSLIIM